MQTPATPPFMRDNPDSLAARMWEEYVDLRTDAMEKVHQSIPRNSPRDYITLEEIASKIGVKVETMETNTANPDRWAWFPFNPVVMGRSRNGSGNITKYYERGKVEIWIAKYNERKSIHAARLRRQDAGRGNPPK